LVGFAVNGTQHLDYFEIGLLVQTVNLRDCEGKARTRTHGYLATADESVLDIESSLPESY